MSPLQAQLIYKYNEHLFFDCTFYVAPQSSYQVVTIRINNIFEEAYYIVGYALMSDKSMSTYIKLLCNIKHYIYQNRENKKK